MASILATAEPSAMQNQSQSGPIIYIVDDDADVREGLRNLLSSVGLRSETFSSTTALLKSKLADEASCLILDVRLPGLSGLDFQAEVTKEQIKVPIIFITGYADVPMSVKAMKAGAVEFLIKPFDDEVLLSAIRHAIKRSAAMLDDQAEITALRGSYESLTPREQDVMRLVVAGMLNKQIGLELGISEITVKAHRGKVMQKMKTDSVADLVKTAVRLWLAPAKNTA